jgi:hypothetical protein
MNATELLVEDGGQHAHVLAVANCHGGANSISVVGVFRF